MTPSFSVSDENIRFHSVEMFEITTPRDNTSAQHVVQNASLGTDCVFIRFNESQYLPWDNPDNIISQEAEVYIGKIKDFILAIAFLIGVPANVINMAVFFKQGLHDRVNLCLFMLAVSDALILSSAFSLHAENIYLHLISEEVIFPGNVFMANNNLIVLYGAGFLSFILSAIIACERCYCVLRPLKYQTLMRTRTMAFIIFSVYVCLFGVYFLVVYRFWIGCVFDPVTGVVSMKVIGGGLYETHQQLIENLESILFGGLITGSTNIVVLAATVITTVKLRQIITWRSETSSSLSSREVALTKMLIGNSVFFIICVSPSSLGRVVNFFKPEIRGGGRHHNFFMSSLWVLESFTFINSSCNFFIYFAMGSRYRETFWALFQKLALCKKERK